MAEGLSGENPKESEIEPSSESLNEAKQLMDSKRSSSVYVDTKATKMFDGKTITILCFENLAKIIYFL